MTGCLPFRIRLAEIFASEIEFLKQVPLRSECIGLRAFQGIDRHFRADMCDSNESSASRHPRFARCAHSGADFTKSHLTIRDI